MRLALVDGRQFLERLIQCNQVLGIRRPDGQVIVNRHFLGIPLQRLARAGIVDQDLPHQVRRYAKEMGTVLKVWELSCQPQIGFVHKRRRL